MQKMVGYVLLISVLTLVTLGIVMLLSTSARYAPDAAADMYGFLRRQGTWLVIGTVICLILSRLDYHHLTRYSPIALGVSALLLVLCFVPHIGKAVKGAHRWLNIAGFTVQPSEFAKLSLICALAWWLGKQRRRMDEFWRGFGGPAAVTGLFALLLLKEPDLGSTVQMGVTLVILLFCAGTPKKFLFPLPVLGFAGILGLAYYMPERRGRLLAFLDIEKYKQGDGWQVWQSLVAFGSGGPNGVGLGNSRQKMYWLPEAHTDFVFPIIGEELGMWVALGVVLLFLILTLCGGWITLHAPDPTGVLLGMGITAHFGVQSLMNFCVVTSLIPNKGVPLPFISYGGSNLMMCLMCVGILFNLRQQGIYTDEAPASLVTRRETPRL